MNEDMNEDVIIFPVDLMPIYLNEFSKCNEHSQLFVRISLRIPNEKNCEKLIGQHLLLSGFLEGSYFVELYNENDLYNAQKNNGIILSKVCFLKF